MLKRIQTANQAGVLGSIGLVMIAGVAFLAFSTVSPAVAHPHDLSISTHSLSFGDDEKDLLEQLIELDADDIEDLRQELNEARMDIEDAIVEIEDAREDVKSVPGAGVIMKIAFGAASKAVTRSTEEIFEDVRYELDQAEEGLAAREDELGPEEVVETQQAIDTIRAGIDEIEAALDQLVTAMRT